MQREWGLECERTLGEDVGMRLLKRRSKARLQMQCLAEEEGVWRGLLV